MINDGGARLVNLDLRVLETLADFLTFRGEQQLVLGGVFGLNRGGTGAGGVDFLVFPSLALDLDERGVVTGLEFHVLYILTSLVFTGAFGLLDLLLLVSHTVLIFNAVGNFTGRHFHVLPFLTILI